MKSKRIGMAGLVVVLLPLASCQGPQPWSTTRAKAPVFLFERFVFLEDAAENTANASIGDLDGDGDPDIVLAKGRHWPLRDLVLLNDGKGGFAERHSLGTEADRTYSAALADLDGDGDLDMVGGNDRPDPKRVYRRSALPYGRIRRGTSLRVLA